MDKEQIRNVKMNTILFLVVGIIFLLIGILFPILWILSAISFYLAFTLQKEYKKQISKETEKAELEKQEKEVPVVNGQDKVKVIDLNGNEIMVSTYMIIEGTEDVLVAEGGSTFHTSIGCFKKWKPEMQEGFKGWKIIKRKEALKMGMKYCAFCEEASRLTLDDLEDFEDDSDDL